MSISGWNYRYLANFSYLIDGKTHNTSVIEVTLTLGFQRNKVLGYKEGATLGL